MAHYANDCWDAEVETSYGWIEVAGHSDRSAFDLERHQAKTKIELMAARPLKTPVPVTTTHCILNKQVLGKEFKKDQAIVVKHLEEIDNADRKALSDKFAAENQIVLSIDGKEFTLTDKHVSFKDETKMQMEEKYIPHVIEPSFGIGRVLYCIFEHCFKVREKDAQRTYFDFPAEIAPVHCSLLPLMHNADMNAKVAEIKKILIRNGVSSKVDDSGQTVGKRYARTDECGIPFAITVDFDTLKDDTVTVRQLDTMKQIRLPIVEVAPLINALRSYQTTWAETVDKYGLVQASEDKE